MEKRLLLIDSDIFINLSAAGLLERSIKLLGFQVKNTRRLDALKNQIQKGSVFQRYSQEIRQTVLADCKKIAPITHAPGKYDVQDRLARVDYIDVGEALMFALMAEHPSYFMATGDKRSLTALAQNSELVSIRNSLAGRIICLETIICLLVQHDGLKPIATSFTPLAPYHKTLRIFFRNGPETSVDHYRNGIESYIRHLEQEVGQNFLFKPPG